MHGSQGEMKETAQVSLEEKKVLRKKRAKAVRCNDFFLSYFPLPMLFQYLY
jgi:hypothetical protein